MQPGTPQSLADAVRSVSPETTLTSKSMDFEVRGWKRVACGVIGPPGAVFWIAWAVTGADGFTWFTWIVFPGAVACGVLFTLLAIRGRVRVPLGRTVVTTQKLVLPGEP